MPFDFCFQELNYAVLHTDKMPYAKRKQKELEKEKAKVLKTNHAISSIFPRGYEEQVQ